MGDATVVADGDDWVTKGAFKNSVPFTKCITKIDGTTIDSVQDWNLVMPMYNVIEFSLNYSDTTCSLCFYFKYEAADSNIDISGVLRNETRAVPLKYLCNLSNHSKCHWLIVNLNWNLVGRSIVKKQCIGMNIK